MGSKACHAGLDADCFIVERDADKYLIKDSGNEGAVAVKIKEETGAEPVIHQLDTEAYFTQFDFHSDGEEADLVAVCISEYMGRPVAHLHCSASVSKDTRHAMVLFSEVINGLSDKAIRRFYERLGLIEGVNKHSKVVIMIALVETLKEEGGKILDIQAVIGNGNESHNYLVLTVTLSSGAVLLFRIQLDNWIEGDGKGQHDADPCNLIKNLCHFPKPVVTSKLQGEPKQPIHFGVVVRLYPKDKGKKAKRTEEPAASGSGKKAKRTEEPAASGSDKGKKAKRTEEPAASGSVKHYFMPCAKPTAAKPTGDDAPAPARSSKPDAPAPARSSKPATANDAPAPARSSKPATANDAPAPARSSKPATANDAPAPARSSKPATANKQEHGASGWAFLGVLDINNQEDCEHLWAEGIKTTEDLMELELEDITAMGQALSLSTKKRLTRFAQLSREEKQRVLDGSSAAAASAAAAPKKPKQRIIWSAAQRAIMDEDYEEYKSKPSTEIVERVVARLEGAVDSKQVRTYWCNKRTRAGDLMSTDACKNAKRVGFTRHVESLHP